MTMKEFLQEAYKGSWYEQRGLSISLFIANQYDSYVTSCISQRELPELYKDWLDFKIN